MKKLIYGLLSFAALSVVSCDYHDPNADKFGADAQAGWVEFASQDVTYYSVTPGFTTDAQFETSVPVVIKNPFNRAVNIDGLTVSYTIEDVSGGNAGFLVSSGNIVLEKGVTSLTIPFTVPASQGASVTCTEFLVTLSTTNRSDVSVGFEDNDIITHTIVVGNVDMASYVGTYDVVQEERNYDTPDADPSVTEYTSVVSLGTEPNELVITNIYDLATTSQTSVFVNPDGTISFPDFIDNLLVAAGGETGNIYVKGKGNKGFVSCNGLISFDFDLLFGPGQSQLLGPINVMMTKQ